MSNPESADSSRSTLRLGMLLAALVWAMAAASYALAAEPGWSLAVGTATAAPQTAVDLPVMLAAGSAPVSAIAFSLEFDATKLVLDADPKLGSKVEIPAPTMFTSSSWVGEEAGTIGVVVYDATRPIGTLADGVVSKVRFRVLPGASGFAAVRISRARPFSAAGERGEPLEGTIVADGGVTITASSGSSLSAVARTTDDEEDVRVAPPADEPGLYVIPLMTAGAESSLIVHNKGNGDASARMTLLRDDGREPLAADIAIPGGATGEWRDPSWLLFGAPGVAGAIVVEVTGSDVLVARSDNGAVAGIPPIPRRDRAAEARILVSDPTRPADVAIANLSTEPARFAVESRDAAGALLDVLYIDVEPQSVRSAIRVNDGVAATASIVIRPLDDSRFAAWERSRDGSGRSRFQIAR